VNQNMVQQKVAVRYGKSVHIMDADHGLQCVGDDKTSGVTVVSTNNNKSIHLTLSDGTQINFQVQFSSMNYIDTTIQLAEHLVGQVNGMCGKFEEPAINKFIGADNKEYPNAIAFGATWKVPDNDNIFLCTDHCPGAPSTAPPAQCHACKLPTIGNIKFEDDYYDYGPYAYPPSQPPRYDEVKEKITITEILKMPVTPNRKATARWVKLATELCTKVLTIAEAKVFVDPEPFLDYCISDCLLSGTYHFVEGWRVKYLDRVHIITKSAQREPHVLYKASEGAVALGLMMDKANAAIGLGDVGCPANCNGRGDCQATGCLCKEGWTGHRCDVQIPVALKIEECFTTEIEPLRVEVKHCPAHAIQEYMTGPKRGAPRPPKYARHIVVKGPH